MRDKKNKILFHYSKLDIGGAERSITKLANILAENNWDVTLVLDVGAGKLEKKLNNKVKIIHFFPKPWKLKIASEKAITKKVLFFILYAIPLIFYTILTFIRKVLFRFHNYDAAVISLQGLNPSFVCYYVNARKKYLYLRNDLSQLKKAQVAENILKYDYLLDGYLCVSNTVLESLDVINSNFKEKGTVLYNIVDIEEIKFLADKEKDPYVKYRENEVPILVSVSRMSDVSKAIFRQLDAAEHLKSIGLKFKWFFVGNGSDLEEFKNRLNEKKLNDCVFPVGEKKNPYPYIKNSDIVCVLSNYEGLSGVVNEAKFLGKSIIATEFSGVNEQLINEKNGLIVENDLDSIITGLKRLLSNEELRNSLENDFINKEISENILKVNKLKKLVSR